MKVVIADDEAPARSRLCSLVEEIGGIEVVAEAANGKEALLHCERFNADVILLDIRMPLMDGMEAAAHLSQADKPPAIIFTTAYGDHALAAFEANAIDYLLKPIRKQRLEQALEKARALSHQQLRAINLADGEKRARSHISARHRNTTLLIPVAEIIYFQADQKYITVHYRSGEILIEESLKSLEEEFAGRFIRSHRNTLLAIDFIEGIEKDPTGQLRVLMRGAAEHPPVSRRHINEIRQVLDELAHRPG